jgi:hypothetical protein
MGLQAVASVTSPACPTETSVRPAPPSTNLPYQTNPPSLAQSSEHGDQASLDHALRLEASAQNPQAHSASQGGHLSHGVSRLGAGARSITQGVSGVDDEPSSRTEFDPGVYSPAVARSPQTSTFPQVISRGSEALELSFSSFVESLHQTGQVAYQSQGGPGEQVPADLPATRRPQRRPTSPAGTRAVPPLHLDQAQLTSLAGAR